LEKHVGGEIEHPVKFDGIGKIQLQAAFVAVSAQSAEERKGRTIVTSNHRKELNIATVVLNIGIIR